MTTIEFPEGFHDHVFTDFAAYLSGLERAGGLVIFKCVDLMSIYRIAPYTYILDVVRDTAGAPRFRVRFAGTETVAALDRDPTGKYLEEINVGPEREDVIDIYSSMLETRCPSASRSGFLVTHPSNLNHFDEHTVTLKRVVFPLTDSGEAIDYFIGALVRVNETSAETGFTRIDFDMP